VRFLHYILDMDFFGECYREHLAKRLLERVMDEEIEKDVLRKLKVFVYKHFMAVVLFISMAFVFYDICYLCYSWISDRI
jgi:hypothetical protein